MIISLTDETGGVMIVVGNNDMEFSENTYYKFIVSMRMDKEEVILINHYA